MSAITAKASRKMKKYAVLTREPRCFLGSFDFSWEQRKLEDYLTVSAEKNTGNIYGRSDVLSVSGDYGIVNQIEFQGRSFAGASVSNYGVVQTGDVVYTKSPLNSNPYGIIKTNKGKPGIVSTLYAVYHPKENAFSDFIQVYFEQHARMNNYMHPLVNKGAKNDMKVSAENALKGPVCFPSRIEQESISAFFSVLDNLITLHQRKCALLFSPFQAFISMMFTTSTFSWEQRKLSEMCGTFEYGLNAAAKEFDGKNKYIRITDIDDASREFLLSDLSSPDICLDGMSKYLLSSGDIVFARTGASVGKTYIYRENDGIVYFAGFLIRAKVNQDNDAEFVFQSTLSPSYEKYIRITSQRSGQPGVNAQEYGEYDLFAPSKEEQQRIGHFLRGIANLITLHQRKCIFFTGRAGRLISTVNKKRITSSWEQRKLGEMGQTYTGLSGKTKDDFGHGQARFVTYMNVFSNPISNPEMTEPIEIDPKQNEVEVGDVFFTTSSETPEEVGMSSILLEKRGKTYLNSFCFGFRPSEKIDSYYLAYMLRSESTRAKIILLAQGISRYNISKNKVMEIAVSLPSLDEQKMIGQYFSQLDNLITLHQRKPFLMKWRTSDANRNQTNRLVL